MLWQVLPPVKALGHGIGAERGKEYHAAQSIKGQSVAERRALQHNTAQNMQRLAISCTAAAPATLYKN